MTGILLLAAGESSRLGQPKQLLPWRGVPLIRHVANIALEANLGPVTVVLGAEDEPCRQALADLPIHILHHASWRDGMGGSIAAGMAAMDRDRLLGVLILLCDQPLIDAPLLRRLAAIGVESNLSIVATRSDDADGPPVWFAARKFPELLALTGPRGAKGILQKEPRRFSIPCPDAASDIDTQQDWQRLHSLSEEAT
jgi:molybdenum cofactor cytidylyltransferase